MAHGEYRWEDSQGLQHSCGECETHLNHPRAKKTCFGKHEEPCPRFHQTLFKIGRGKSCDSCKMSEEQHLKRHHEIYALIREFKATGIPTSLGKMVISPDDIQMAIHGYSEDLTDEDPEACNRTSIKDLRLQHRIHQSKHKAASSNTPNREVSNILKILGIERHHFAGSKLGLTYLRRLENFILQDIKMAANESRETLRRQLGYYKYADQRNFKAMLEYLVVENKKSMDNKGIGVFHGVEEVDRYRVNTSPKRLKRSDRIM